ncbi:MAG: proline--tRNA ligase [Acidimicrobiia bacterium]|nr:proline--tRNA ligase [Acidimicrobiia bacterium]
MRWSQAHIPTLRDDPAEAEAVSHKLLVRGGFIRQLSSGHYSMLPMGQKVRMNIDRVIREEMDAIGGQQFHLPALHPAEIWKKSGRWESMGEEMFRLVDRKGADNALGMTHEEIFALLAAELTSYRQLPQIWYQIQTKFRDEPRPKSGVLRVREFTMKDSYSLDIDAAGLDAAFRKHHAAYVRIFERLGLEAVAVEASSGIMGGSESTEFMVPSAAGEDWIVTCASCEYAANVERARSKVETVEDPGSVPEPSRFATPDIRTIKGLAEAFPDIARPERQIKTLVYLLDGTPTLVLMRGDHELQEQKLVDITKTVNLRPAQADEINELLGAHPGSLGSVGVTGITIIADEALRGRRGLVTGANEDDWHLRDVDVERDIAVTQWADLRAVKAGEPCPIDGGSLDLWKGVEVGHIFKLGTRYSEAMGAYVQDPNGDSHPVIMGSYGIGLERNMATVVEVHHDERGIIWPVGIGPWDVVLTTLRADDESVQAVATALYEELHAAGISVIYDDRVERPGVKFADAELVGMPFRITIGPRGLESETAEFTPRSTMETTEIAIADCVSVLRRHLG